MSFPAAAFEAAVLRDLDAPSRSAIEQAGRGRQLADNAVIYRGGEAADAFFVLLRGTVRLGELVRPLTRAVVTSGVLPAGLGAPRRWGAQAARSHEGVRVVAAAVAPSHEGVRVVAAQVRLRVSSCSSTWATPSSSQAGAR